MDFLTKKTTHQIMPLFSAFWTSAAKPEPDPTAAGATTEEGTKAGEPVVMVNGEPVGEHDDNSVQKHKTPSSPIREDAASIPLPLSPASASPEISKAPSRKRRRTRTFPPSKVFILRAPAVKRTDGKKNRLAASDVTVHFPKLHIDKGMPEDMQERLVEASTASDLDLDGYILSTNSISSFSLLAMDTSARIANFSLPLHPHKVITVFFPPSSTNARPRPQSCSSSISNSSAVSITSASRRQQPKKMTQQMLTMTSPGAKTKAFIFDGFSFRWLIEEDGTRVLRRYSVSPESSGKAVEGELCARYSAVKRKGFAALLVDPSRCDERVAIATLFHERYTPRTSSRRLGMAITGTQAIACEWSFLALAAFFVCFRLYVRIFITRNPSFTDALVALVWFCFLSTVICDTISASKGLFAENLTYSSDLIAAFRAHGGESLDDLITVLQLLYASSFPYICELWGLKICFLILYGGLIPRSMRWLRVCLYVTWAVVVVGFIASVLLMAVWCIPVTRNWDITKLMGDEGRCFAYSSYEPYFTLTAFHVVTDIMIYTLPFPVLKTLSLNRRQHWGVISIFALGGLCIACTIGRTVAVGLVSNIPLVGFWTTLEQMTGLIVVCVPALKVLILEHRSRDVSRAKVDLTNEGSRLSRLQRISVTATRSDGRGGGDDEESVVRWVRVDSPMDAELEHENTEARRSASSLSIEHDPPRRVTPSIQRPTSMRFAELESGRRLPQSFDEHLDSRQMRRMTLRRGSFEGADGGGPSKKLTVVDA
ncbi:hypothetical protein Dda_9074 [Drechslerella dactyloides]|uniref:Rhodopsin domain-containing protein n=1 Tax=Drechslerella dactyloides TaxID=74499 RepID=A0AAD6NFJ0_DREDA|nr:hypothetical protein Dda_9074 [Drechslerella dactyloides]